MVVYNTGDISWIPPGIFKISCKIDIKWFPFDEQRCFFKVSFTCDICRLYKKRLLFRGRKHSVRKYQHPPCLFPSLWIFVAYGDIKLLKDFQYMQETILTKTSKPTHISVHKQEMLPAAVIMRSSTELIKLQNAVIWTCHRQNVQYHPMYHKRGCCKFRSIKHKRVQIRC